MIETQRAVESDIELLRMAAVSAFLDDERYKPLNARPGGPPGHDLLENHIQWIRDHDYFKCVVHGDIAGGCIVKRHPPHCQLFGIFLHRNFIGQGIGSLFLRAVIKLYPKASPWSLETPDYAERNHRFYEHNGFTVSEKLAPDPSLGYGFVLYIRA